MPALYHRVIRRVGGPADPIRQARRLPYVSRNPATLDQTDLVTVTPTLLYPPHLLNASLRPPSYTKREKKELERAE